MSRTAVETGVSPAKNRSRVAMRRSTCKKPCARVARRSLPLPAHRGGSLSNRSTAIETRSLPALARSYPRRFTLITRTASCFAPATLAALPSTRAIPNRDVFYLGNPFLDSWIESLAVASHPLQPD